MEKSVYILRGGIPLHRPKRGLPRRSISLLQAPSLALQESVGETKQPSVIDIYDMTDEDCAEVYRHTILHITRGRL